MTIVIVTKIVTDQKLSQKIFFDWDSMIRDELLIVIEGLISRNPEHVVPDDAVSFFQHLVLSSSFTLSATNSSA